MAIESSFIPFPSEVVVPPAAYKAAGGELNVVLVVLSATFGAAVGASINYFLAYWLGRPIVYRFADSRLGHVCLLDRKKVETAEEFFRKNGIVSTLVGRLVPAVRQLISIPAGLSKMSFGLFLLYTAVGAGIWNSILATIGYVLHSYIKPEDLQSTVKMYSHQISILFLVIGVFVFGYILYKGIKKK